MKVNNLRVAHKVNFDVDDAPTYTFPRGQSFTPDRVEISYIYGEPGRSSDRVLVVLRGTIGPNSIHADFYQGEARPEWVTELVNFHMPTDFTI